MADKASSFRELSEEELVQRMTDTRKEMFNLRVQQAIGQLENPSRIRHLRREVARLETVSTERRKAKEV